jgi:hypothetical protein
MKRSGSLIVAALACCFIAAISRHAAPRLTTPPPIDGIRCEGMEGAVVHIHQYLALYDGYQRVTVPALIGIHDQCLYWLHTHTADGLIHDEVPIRKFFTLGNFFDVWKQPLNWYQAGPLHARRGTKLKITVNGKAFKGNPRNIELDNHTEIIIKSGPPYITHPPHYNWGNMG